MPSHNQTSPVPEPDPNDKRSRPWQGHWPPTHAGGYPYKYNEQAPQTGVEKPSGGGSGSGSGSGGGGSSGGKSGGGGGIGTRGN